MDSQNRPYCVKKLNIDSGEKQTLFVDDDPTHFVDIRLSKDKEFIFIDNGTKENCEVWAIDNREGSKDLTPRLFIKRQKDVRVHVEHVRDFFIKISNNDPKSKNFKL